MSVHCGEANSLRRCSAQPLLTEPIISRAEIRHCGEVLALSVGNLYAVTRLGQRSQFGQLKRCEFNTLFGGASCAAPGGKYVDSTAGFYLHCSHDTANTLSPGAIDHTDAGSRATNQIHSSIRG